MSTQSLAQVPNLFVGGGGSGGTPGAPRGALLTWGDVSVGATTTTRFLSPGFGDQVLASTLAIQFRMPFAGTLENPRVRHNIPGGNGNAIVYTLRVNGVATLLLVSLASNAADGSDLVNQIVVAAGDLLDIEVTKAANVAMAPNNVVVVLQVAA